MGWVGVYTPEECSSQAPRDGREHGIEILFVPDEPDGFGGSGHDPITAKVHPLAVCPRKNPPAPEPHEEDENADMPVRGCWKHVAPEATDQTCVLPVSWR